MGELRCGGVAVCEISDVGELQCRVVAIQGSGFVGTMHYVGVTVVTKPEFIVLGLFSHFLRNLQQTNYLQKFTAAKPFALAHFSIAHWKDIFPENFFIPKSTPASDGPTLTPTCPPLPKQKSETHSYSSLLKKSKKPLLLIFF